MSHYSKWRQCLENGSLHKTYISLLFGVHEQPVVRFHLLLEKLDMLGVNCDTNVKRKLAKVMSRSQL